MEQDKEEVICIGRYDDYAVFADEYNSIKVLNDPEKIINPGELCMEPNVLQNVETLEPNQQERILNLYSM